MGYQVTVRLCHSIACIPEVPMYFTQSFSFFFLLFIILTSWIKKKKKKVEERHFHSTHREAWTQRSLMNCSRSLQFWGFPGFRKQPPICRPLSHTSAHTPLSTLLHRVQRRRFNVWEGGMDVWEGDSPWLPASWNDHSTNHPHCRLMVQGNKWMFH